MPDVSPQPDLFSAVPRADGRRRRRWERSARRSSTYRAQKKLVGRVAVTDDAIAALVDALASTPDRRLSATRAATLLGVPANRAAMVMSQVSKLLNVEGYPVVATDPATQAVTLDAALLAEQYGVRESGLWRFPIWLRWRRR